MKKTTFPFLVVLLSITCSVSAQDFESFEEFKRRSKKEFKEFVDRENAAFAEMLREQWVAFDALRNEQKKRLEPKEPIKYLPPAKVVAPTVVKIDLPVVASPKITPPVIELPKIDNIPTNHPEFSFEFYGQKCSLHIPNAFRFTLRAIDENNVSSQYEILAKSDFKGFINEALVWKQKLGLNDWFFKQFVEKLTTAYYSNSTNERVLASCFIFVQSGYNVKMGRSDEQLILMLPFDETLYSRSYLNMDGVYYYLFGNKGSQIYTYKATPTAGRNFSVRMQSELTPDHKAYAKEFNVSKANAKVQVLVNNNLRPLMTDYPQCDVINYAQAPLSKELKETLIPQLGKLVQGKDRTQAANILINFVQTAFQYKTDPEQFGYERPFFAEELFLYPFSDCEDRSVLFSQLVRHILQLDVVLLDYPDHIATAVFFDDDAIKGDYLLIEGKRYLVCDPTYINAPIGSTMPQYKGVVPKVWKIAQR